MGVYRAPNGMTHFVASMRLLGQTFQDSRRPSLFSMLAKSAMTRRCYLQRIWIASTKTMAVLIRLLAYCRGRGGWYAADPVCKNLSAAAAPRDMLTKQQCN